MNALQLLPRAKRGFRILGAFTAMGYRTAIAYPAALVLSQIQPLFQVLVFFFVAKLVDRSGPAVGGDYFTFVVLGWAGVQMLQAGLGAFSTEVNFAVQQGRFEMFLVEPIRWRLLPFGLVQWPIIQKSLAVAFLLLVSALLGANYRVAGLLPAVAVLALGVVASMAIGIISGTMVILAKRGDPVITLYALAASLLSGALFPIELLPAWLRGLSWLLPQTYVIAALRRALMPNGELLPGASLEQATLGLMVFILIGVPLALWVFGRAMEAGRKMGVLSGY